MKIDILRSEILGEFGGARAYLDLMCRAMPEVEQRAAAELRDRAEKEGWEWEDFSSEKDDLDGIFRHHFPKVLTYSFLTYLHSLVEVELNAVARDSKRRRGLNLKHNEIAGSPIERVQKYLAKVCGLQISDDPGWSRLRDLAKVRDVIVHRGGEIGPDPVERKGMRELVSRVPNGIATSNGWDDEHSTLEIAPAICSHFLEEAAAFFDRLLAITRACAPSA